MFYNLKIILRTLRRNFTYSAINIAGLAIGITASVYIFLWVHHERSYDRYHTDAGRIYRIDNQQKSLESGQEEKIASSPYNLLSMVRDFPEVERSAATASMVEVGVGDAIKGIKVNHEVFSVADRKAVFVEPEWFDVFDYTLLEGSFVAFAEHPNSIALTRSEAKKIFGNVSAVGQTVGVNGVDHTVQAVVTDNPSNSSFQWNVFAPLDSYSLGKMLKGTNRWWGMYFGTIYVKLHPNADVAAVAQKINDIYAKNEYDAIASLTPLSAIYFDTGSIYTGGTVKGDSRMVSLFGILGVLLLLTACINYINLATAKANMRTKEVGVKKIAGAKRHELILQIIAESFVLCFIAIALALFFIYLLSPFYHLLIENAVLNFSTPVIWITLVIILMTTSLLNGIYPALMLSSFQPVNLLKGIGLLKIKGGVLRKILVVFQFALSATLIIYVVVIYAQMNYIQQKDPGYIREHVVSIKGPSQIVSGQEKGSVEMKLQAVLNELRSEPAIITVSLCNNEIVNLETGGMDQFDWDGKAENFNPYVYVMNVDAQYQKTLGLQLVEGRWFEEDNRTESHNCILNETAIRVLGIQEPYIGQRFEMPDFQKWTIIGVVKDFHYRSLREKIEPLLLTCDEMRTIINMKIHPGQTVKALQSARVAWATHFPNDPFEYAFLDDSFNKLYRSEIKTSRLMLLFSAFAIFIALLGLFGLSTFAVERRFKEIGVRKVLGASISDIVHLLTKEFLYIVGVALLIAFPIAYYWADRMLQDYAYRISIEWWIFAFAGMITVALTLLTIGWKAIKAASANPVEAIKAE